MTAQQWHTAENLFHSALELPPDKRARWVAEACPQDPALVDAVVRMLAADAQPGDEIRRAVRSAIKEWIEK